MTPPHHGRHHACFRCWPMAHGENDVYRNTNVNRPARGEMLTCRSWTLPNRRASKQATISLLLTCFHASEVE